MRAGLVAVGVIMRAVVAAGPLYWQC